MRLRGRGGQSGVVELVQGERLSLGRKVTIMKHHAVDVYC